MKSGVCPKCGSDEVYSGPSSSLLSKRYNIIPITIWSYTVLDYYVCVNCGYVENYISDAKKLQEIAEEVAESEWREKETR